MADRSSALFILGSTLLGAGLGLPFGGLLGALGGGLAGICVSMCADAVIKAQRSGQLHDAPALPIEGLNDQQKFAVLGQSLGGGRFDFRPKALQEAQRVETLAQQDLEAGLREAKELEAQHPRVPALSMLHARLALQAEHHDRAVDAASRAFESAARGGMNALAVEYLLEIDEDLRAALSLSKAAWTQLSRALRSAKHAQLAAWADQQAAAADPLVDAQREAKAMQAVGEALRRKDETSQA